MLNDEIAGSVSSLHQPELPPALTKKMSANHLPAIFLGSTAFVFINFGLPIYADELGLDALMIGGTYTVFMLTILFVRPLVGVGLDRLGRRGFFILSFAFYCIAMLAFSYAEGVEGLYLARFLQGMGASFMWVTAQTMVADISDVQSRGVAMGKLTTNSVRGSMIGAIYGFTLLGFMPLQAAWPIAFLGYAFIAAIAFFWRLVKVKETRTETAKFDPRFELSMPLRKIFVLVFLTGFASALIEPIYLLYLKNKFDMHLVVLAWVFLPAGLVFAFLPRYSGAWSDRFGRGPIIAVGISFAGMVSLALPFWPFVVLVSLSYIFFSVGWAFANPAIDALVADHAPPSARGRVIGLQEGAAGLGAAFGPLVGGAMYEHVSPLSAFVSNGIILLISAVLAWHWFARGQPRLPG